MSLYLEGLVKGEKNTRMYLSTMKVVFLKFLSQSASTRYCCRSKYLYL